MVYNKIIQELSRNKDIFENLLTNVSKEESIWKAEPDKWCLLEIVSHLFDEEREDFRARTRHVLETPQLPFTPIDPAGWVKSRKYMENDYEDVLTKFLIEREQSVLWLQSLINPKWENTYQHSKFGSMSAKMFLANWLAHDYLHIKQILKLKFDYLKVQSDETLVYAGTW